MKTCPKCSSQSADGVKICRTCGSILPAVAAELPTCQEEGACQAAPALPSSWNCAQCGESAPGGFDICWNCGTSKDGTPDPDFGKNISVDEATEGWGEADTESATPVRRPMRRCSRCDSSKIIPNVRILDRTEYGDSQLRLAIDANPDALIFKDRAYGHLTADICGDCGHVELKVDNPAELYEHYRPSVDGLEKGEER
jgi:hypothetical protein